MRPGNRRRWVCLPRGIHSPYAFHFLVVSALAAGLPGPRPALAAFERGSADPAVEAVAGITSVGGCGVFSSAALPREDGARGALATATRPFGLPGLAELQAHAWRGGRWAGGAGVRRFGTASYAEKEARIVLTGGDAVLRAGIAVRALELSGTGIAPWRSLAVDAALRIRPEAGLEVGVVLEGLLGEVPGDPGGRFRRTTLGVRRSLGTSLDLLLEAEGRGEAPLAGRAGLRWRSQAGLGLSAGVGDRPDRVSWGLAVARGAAEARAAVSETALGRTLRLGVAWNPSPAFSAGPGKPIP